MNSDITQWSTIKPYITDMLSGLGWAREEDRERLAAYAKYDEFYWNDAQAYALRVLEGETPLYIPNARVIVDTTAHYTLKGLTLDCENSGTKKALDEFLKREVFYSRFASAKQSGTARGDWAFHMTANPKKAKGSRISMVPIDPGTVFPIYDEDLPDKMIGCHIAFPYERESDPGKTFLRRLTYRVEENADGTTRRISRREDIWELEHAWFGGDKAKLVKTIIPFGYLDERIKVIPVYWFKNRDWLNEAYGASELRGFEPLLEVISQGSTDIAGALSLEGLGVYATDGGRPIDESGAETEWEVAPGKVMEVPQGSYFRRVEGVSSITPAKDNIDYLEGKMNQASGLSDVALGTVDAMVAQSGIALAIRFQPTLAKIETRDQAGKDRLTQMFFDWKTWVGVFEQETLDGDIIPNIGDKLPIDRTARVNELNNMIDRKIIPMSYYRDEMVKLGYTFPKNIEDLLDKEREKSVQASREAFLATKDTTVPGSIADKASGGDGTSTAGETLPTSGNRSNNAKRPNESAGTEATNKTRDA